MQKDSNVKCQKFYVSFSNLKVSSLKLYSLVKSCPGTSSSPSPKPWLAGSILLPSKLTLFDLDQFIALS